MARPIVPDTTAFVHAIRQAHQPFFDAVLQGQVWLSAVVACELYAGTRSTAEARLLDRLVHGAVARERLLVPGAEDWSAAGRLLACRIRLARTLRPRDHISDVLIVVSSERIGGEILTSNRVHFETWANLARRSGMNVIVGRRVPSAWSG